MIVKLHPEALTEIKDSIQWYDTRKPGLGDEFKQALYECVDLISRNPTLFACVHKKIRKVFVRKFPHQIYYEVIGDFMVVYAVFHPARNPEKLQSRLNS